MVVLPRPKEYKLMTVDKYWQATTDHLSDQEKTIIDDKIQNVIRYDPYDSELLQGELKGLRSYNKIKSGNRIIFAICYECRNGGWTTVNNCIDCDSTGNNVVKLFGAGPHSLYDILKRKRQKMYKKRKKSGRN